MFLQVLKSKIHRVTVTEANLDYIGSITIDEDLMNAANIYAGEKVQVVDSEPVTFTLTVVLSSCCEQNERNVAVFLIAFNRVA